MHVFNINSYVHYIKSNRLLKLTKFCVQLRSTLILFTYLLIVLKYVLQFTSTKLNSSFHYTYISISSKSNVFKTYLLHAIGTQHTLQLLYEHKLRRTAANFVVGPFGGSQNREFICVQSLDGMLTVFEQESFAFCTFLPDFLLPGPLAYLTCSDTFITASSDWQLSAFR